MTNLTPDSRFKDDFVKDSTVVELGCGTGVVGLVCATLPTKKVLLTDLPAVQELAEKNIAQNKELLRAECVFSPLDWNDPAKFEFLEKPKIIIASECVYYSDAIKPLVQTMEYLSGPDTRIFVSFEFREHENNVLALKKFLKMAKESFSVKEIPFGEQDEDYRSEDIKLLLLRKKSEP